jgi:hypothetical protein
MQTRSESRSRDAGQAAVFVVIILTTIAIVLIMAVARLGTAVLDRSAAQTAADAAALASLSGGRDAAAAVALANGGVVVAWSSGPAPDEVMVTVRVGEEFATARATDAP